MMKAINLSIIMISYKHENFICEAIDGVVFQNTKFNVELIIADDNSPDDTEKIVNNYLRKIKQPSTLSIIYKKHKKNKRPNANFLWAMEQAKGKYIAVCEGDDYWTDPYKLQKQVDFLEANPDYVVCCHNAKIIDENGKLIQEKKLPKLIQDRDYSSLELQQGAFLLTLSMVFRNVIREFPSSFAKVLNGDKFLISLLGAYGKGRYIEDIKPAVYRKHPGGVWSELDVLHRLKAKRLFFDGMLDYYKDDIKLYSYFYQEQTKISRKLLSDMPKSKNIKSYFDYNLFYLKYNPVLKSKSKFKEFLRYNIYFFRSLFKSS